MKKFVKGKWRGIAILLLLLSFIGGTAMPALADVVRVRPPLPYLEDIVDDTTPELGGDLDAEGYKIHDYVVPYAAKTAAYTTTVDDEIIAVDTTFGAVTITLGSAACRAGQIVVVKDYGGYSASLAITIATEGAELIDSAATDTINRNGFSKQYYSNGSNWFSYSLTDNHDVFGLLELGLFAAIPAFGTTDRLYFSSDTNILWRDSGFAWGAILRGETATRLAQLAEKEHASLTSLDADDHPQYLLVADLENPPIEDEASAAPTSEWAFDHDADGTAHQSNVITITLLIDGGGSALSTGSKGHLEIPFACTITGWTILADVSGSAVVDVKRCTYAGFPTTSSIAGTEKPTLSSAQKNQDLSLTTWTTAIAAGDILEFVFDSGTTCTRVTVSLRATKS